MQTPLVSVVMTTYNHAPYLRQAIEGVLAQQTPFDVELVLGEDCSTDATPAICRAVSRSGAAGDGPRERGVAGQLPPHV